MVLAVVTMVSQAAVALPQTEPPPAAASGLHFNVGWPEGIEYEVRKASPRLEGVGPFSYLTDVYLRGRVGVRLDLDAAVFLAAERLSDFDDDVTVRRGRVYLLGDLRLALPLSYKLEFSVESSHLYLNDFYLRWRPGRWLDTLDIGYLTPPMGLENVISSRSLTLMEEATPVEALAPGFRTGIAAAGHWDRWPAAWKAGFFSTGQEQLSGDASKTSAQFIGRLTAVPWRQAESADEAFLHLGASLSYAFSGSKEIQYRSRPESFIAPYMVDTGETSANNALASGFEGAWSQRALLVSAEVLQSTIDAEQGTQTFWGTYVAMSWMATGESHPYDRTTGMFERIMPSAPFPHGWGAVELGERLSWLDLSNGGVHGGEMISLASGITWHLNAELRLFANYVFAHAQDGPQRGAAHIFQTRIEVGI